MCASIPSTLIAPENPSRKRYKNVRLPIELYGEILKEAEERGVAMWKVIADAFTRYKLWRKKPEERMRVPRLDKASWYVFKLANSVGALKENPTPENAERLMRTISQIEERTGVNCELLKKTVSEFLAHKDTFHKVELNDVTKMTIGDIIVKLIFGEET